MFEYVSKGFLNLHKFWVVSHKGVSYKTIQFSLSAAGLLCCGRFCYWTFLLWEILLLDFFAVGDCGTGLFCCGRFYCWTFLLWEILMLDFLASGQMNRQAVLPYGAIIVICSLHLNGYLICQVVYLIILRFVTLKKCKVVSRLILGNFYSFTLHTDYLNNKVGNKKSCNFELNHSPSNQLYFFTYTINSFFFHWATPWFFTIKLCTTPYNSVLCIVLVYIGFGTY